MAMQLLDRFITDIDHFPKSLENCSTKFFKSKEKEVENILKEEVQLVFGASKTEYEQMRRTIASLEKIVKGLLSGDDIENSYVEYKKIEHGIENEVPSHLYLFAKQSLISVKALYYYKKKKWNSALAVTLECNALNDYLVQQGIYSLVSRVIEQNKNISSIFLREQKFDRAYLLLFNLFNYLFNGINKSLYGNIFNSTSIWSKTTMLREAYIYQIFVNIVADTVRFNFYNKECFLPSKWYLDLDFKTNNTNRKILSDWIYINKQLRKNNCKEFLIALTSFLNEPMSSHYDILKISLVIELNKLIDNCNYPNKEQLLKKIVFFLKEKIEEHTRIRELMIKKLNKQIALEVKL